MANQPIDPEQMLTATMAQAFVETIGGVAHPRAKPEPVRHGYARYLPGRELGQGGMGRVVAARDSHFGREVALKLLTGERSPSREARFITEATVTANLEHPGIVDVFERGGDETGRPFYAMALVRGRTLTEAIAGADTLQARLKLLPAVIRVAHALGYAHERGVIHRDIKPDNVIVGEHGETTLIDWGVAKIKGLSIDFATWREEEGALIGTVAYMSPEQAAGAADLDERADVFQLGALLYHVLAGRPPYTGQTLGELLSAALEARFVDIAELVPEIAPPLAAVIRRAMARRREERYPSAIDMARDLEDALSRSWTHRRSPWIAALTAGSAAVGLLALGVLFAVVTQLVPSFEALGFPVLYVMIWPAAGIALSLVELCTRGRHRLSRLIVAFAGAAFASAVAGGIANLLVVLENAARPDTLADPERWRFIMSEGPWEALGVIPLGAASAAFQLILWALVARRVESRARSAAG